MSFYAVDDIDDALETTQALLWPFSWRTWVKLAFIIFFIGGSGGQGNVSQYNVPSSRQPAFTGAELDPPAVSEFLSVIGPAIIAIGIAVVALVLFFQFVAAVMEFVLVESLRNRSVTIRRYWGRHWRRGVRLFGFRLVLSIVGLAILAILVIIILVPLLFDTWSVSLVAIVALIPFAILFAIFLALLHGFTTMFVVPIMLVEERGVLSGWARFWPTLRRQWKQYLVYALLNMVLSIAGGIVTVLGTLIAVVILLIPFAILGGLVFVVSQGLEIAGLLLGIPVLLLFVVALFAVVMLIRVPVVTYLRYYALLVLGDTNGEFDLIPEQRARVRDEPSTTGGEGSQSR